MNKNMFKQMSVTVVALISMVCMQPVYANKVDTSFGINKFFPTKCKTKVSCEAFSPDGKYFVVGTNKEEYNIRTMIQFLPFHNTGTITIFETQHWQKVKTITIRSKKIAFSSDCQYLAIRCSRLGMTGSIEIITVFKTQNWEKIKTIESYNHMKNYNHMKKSNTISINLNGQKVHFDFSPHIITTFFRKLLWKNVALFKNLFLKNTTGKKLTKKTETVSRQ